MKSGALIKISFIFISVFILSNFVMGTLTTNRDNPFETMTSTPPTSSDNVVESDSDYTLVDPLPSLNEENMNYSRISNNTTLYDNSALVLVEPLDEYYRLDYKVMYRQLFQAVVQGNLNYGLDETLEEDCLEPVEGEYNIVFLVYDEIDPANEMKEYVKIYVDRKQVGVTNQAFRSDFKFYKMWLSPGKYILNLEKWSYNDITNRWVREPNMNQPDAKYFETSTDQITVIEVVYFDDTQSYEYYASCMTESDLELFDPNLQ